MFDRPIAAAVASVTDVVTLGRRRALFAAAVGITGVGVLWLAATAVPPRGAGSILFLASFAVTLPWSVVGVWNAIIGFLILSCAHDPVAAVNPMAARVRGDEKLVVRTAILACIRNENPNQVTRNLRALLEGLAAAGVGHLFHVYVLSDSSDPDIIASEYACITALAEMGRKTVSVTYRRRAANTGFKAGNIREFCDRWGTDHEFFITLDADSFMPAETVLRLVRIMQANPTLGILQTLAVGLPSTSAFARLFQFGMRLGMRSYTLGSAWWQGDCGPYWGHNAILRSRPFVAHCRMPLLHRRGPLGGHVLSHDQLEAALMRRAGHEVRVPPVEGMSWEESPTTLMEYIRRDLRWCHGNMQYLQLLTLPGLKPVSRFQLIFAILMYLGSPAWMALMAICVVAIASSSALGASAAYVRPGADTALFAIMLSMAFAPKIASSIDVLARRSARRSYGGAGKFASSFTCETFFSFLLSPVMALTHTLFLARLFLLGRGGGWDSQRREIHAVSWRLAWAWLWLHALIGFAVIGVVVMMAPNNIDYALLAGGGLALSAPFAVVTASPVVGTLLTRIGLGRIPEETEPPTALRTLQLSTVDVDALGASNNLTGRQAIDSP